MKMTNQGAMSKEMVHDNFTNLDDRSINIRKNTANVHARNSAIHAMPDHASAFSMVTPSVPELYNAFKTQGKASWGNKTETISFTENFNTDVGYDMKITQSGIALSHPEQSLTTYFDDLFNATE